MRTQHETHQLPGFPMYSSAFLAPGKIVLGGGGGSSRSGVKNKLRLYKISSKDLELVDEYELEPGADAPMSIAFDAATNTIICGINTPEEVIEKGENRHCRVFDVKEDSIRVETSLKLSRSNDKEHFQRVTALSPTGSLIAVGTTDNELSLLYYPSLAPASQIISISEGELWDTAFSATTLVITSTTNLFVYQLPVAATATSSPADRRRSTRRTKSKAKAATESSILLEKLELVNTVSRPTLPKNGATSVSFRSGRFHPEDWTRFYTAVNALVPSGNRTQAMSFIVQWDTKTWEVAKIRKIADAKATCFDVSPNGRYLATGTSDCSISLFDAQTLSPLLAILKSHDFPSSTLRFSPDTRLLISGSADNSLRVVALPEKFAGQWRAAYFVYLTLLIILIAVLVQLFYNQR